MRVSLKIFTFNNFGKLWKKEGVSSNSFTKALQLGFGWAILEVNSKNCCFFSFLPSSNKLNDCLGSFYFSTIFTIFLLFS